MVQAQNTNDYFSIDSVSFEKEDYFLVWSNSSNDSYYKHEYIRKTDSITSFNKMISIEVLHGNLTPEDLATKKAKEMENRKASDPVTNYQLIDNTNTGEYLLDFLISDGDLYEWNAYRYKLIDTPKGKAVMLFAFTIRSFDGAELDLNEFFNYIKENRTELIVNVANYKLPKVTLTE
jgi:hypothetical protein